MSGPLNMARLFPSMVDLLAKKDVNVHGVTEPVTQALRARATRDLLEELEKDLAPHVASAFQGLIGNAEIPAELAPILEAAGAPEHPLQSVVVGVAVFSIVNAIVQSVMQPYLTDLMNTLWEHHTSLPLSPPDAALAEIRGHWTHDRALHEANQTGFDKERYDAVLYNTGEPPALEQLLFLYRRGDIDRARLERGIKQSRTRDEWIDAIEALRYVPIGAAEAVAAAVESHIDQDTMRTLIAQNGIDPQWADVMYETAGRPPGIAEFGTLVNRGLQSEDEWAQAIRESDIKNKYIPAVLRLRDYVPPVRTVTTLLRQKTITVEQAVALFAANGVLPDDIQAYVAQATKEKLQGGKDIAQSHVLDAYRDLFTDRATAATMLGQLDYDPGEQAFLLDLTDYERERRRQDNVIAATRSRFVGHHIDAQQVVLTLDAANVPAASRDELLKLWTLERANVSSQLTRADLVNAFNLGIIDADEWTARLSAMGYSDVDVAIIQMLAQAKAVKKQPSTTQGPTLPGQAGA